MVTPAWGVSPERYEAVDLEVTNRPSQIVPMVGAGQRVLDVGCGIGSTAQLLRQNDCRVVGVEYDPIAAARASAFCERVVVCDLDVVDLSVELAGDQFDVVLAADVLEHLRDPGRLLRSLHPLLAPGGRLVTSIPNVAHGSVRLALFAGEFPYADMGILDRTHLRFFTRSSAEALLAEGGFSIDALERTEAPIWIDDAVDPALLPEGLLAAVEGLPEATTFQFVIGASPTTDLLVDGSPAASGRNIVPTGSAPRTLVAAQSEVIRSSGETIAALETERARLTSELTRLEATYVWRTWTRVRSLLGPNAARLRTVIRTAEQRRARADQ